MSFDNSWTAMGPMPPPITHGTKPRPIRRPSAAGIMSVNAVYFPNYRVYRGETPGGLNYGCVSHVFYAFAMINPDGFVILGDEWADVKMDVDGAQGCMGSLMRLKQQHKHLKVILSIGGARASQNFAAVAASPALRNNFARSCRKLVSAAGFDGVDIDWEHPSNAEQGRDFLSLLATTRIHLPEDRFLLTAALPAGRWVLEHIDLNKAQEFLDYINLMAYDFTGPWTPLSGHHSQLYGANASEPSGAAAVEYVISTGFPSTKILLGVPVYGRSFLGAVGPGQPYSGHGGDEGTFEYKTLPRDGARETFDARSGAASCVGGDGGFVSYDNPESVRMKGEYCKTQQLGGLFYWTGTADVARGPRSLVETGFKALHGG